MRQRETERKKGRAGLPEAGTRSGAQSSLFAATIDQRWGMVDTRTPGDFSPHRRKNGGARKTNKPRKEETKEKTEKKEGTP